MEQSQLRFLRDNLFTSKIHITHKFLLSTRINKYVNRGEFRDIVYYKHMSLLKIKIYKIYSIFLKLKANWCRQNFEYLT